MSENPKLRAAEREQAHEARRQAELAELTNPVVEPLTFENPTPAGGPRTAAGKAVSCLNHLKHGLTGAFRVLATESQSEFDAAHEALLAEHKPQTPTESELVRRMTEHAWCSRRAQILMDTALESGDMKQFALMLRYQTTNDRGFRNCLHDLFRLRKDRRAAAERHASEFESSTIAGGLIPGLDRIPEMDLSLCLDLGAHFRELMSSEEIAE